MAPKLVWYSKQNMQHGVSQNLWDLCQVSFCFTPTGDDECICMRRWRTLVELQFVKKKEKNKQNPHFIDRTFFFQIVNLSMNVTHVVV